MNESNSYMSLYINNSSREKIRELAFFYKKTQKEVVIEAINLIHEKFLKEDHDFSKFSSVEKKISF